MMQTPNQPMQPSVNETKIVIAEGKDDVGFLRWFIGAHGLQGFTLIEMKGTGLDHLLDGAGSVFDGAESIAVIRDADRSEADAFKNVTDVLKEKFDGAPRENGTFIEANNLK
jgi:hypothetical protein